MTKQETAYVVACDGKRIYGTGSTLPAAIRSAKISCDIYEAKIKTKRGVK